MAAIKPNFLIAGASKSGTTSLHEYLAQHPDIFMSARKEPNYFVPGNGCDDWESYLALFRDAQQQKAIGESSAAYLYSKESPELIKARLGPVKIILMLRNPARRAESLYWWMVREGYENAPTFAEALVLEFSRSRDSHFRENCPHFFADYLYFDSGLYSTQVERFLETFGANNLRIYLFEEFAADPRAICREIFTFLGVDPNFQPAISVHNRARLPASPRLQFWLRNRAPRYLRFLPGKVRRAVIEGVMDLNKLQGATPARDFESEQRLLERYRDDIRALERLSGRDLSFWISEHSRHRVMQL